VALTAPVAAQAQLLAHHARCDHRRGAQRLQRRGQAVRLGVAARGAGGVAHRAHVACHQCGRRLGHDADGNVHLVADQVVHPVFKAHIEHDAGVQPLEVDQPVDITICP
jgi:hypothetical protein